MMSLGYKNKRENVSLNFLMLFAHLTWTLLGTERKII